MTAACRYKLATVKPHLPHADGGDLVHGPRHLPLRGDHDAAQCLRRPVDGLCMYLYMSYAMPVMAGLLAEGKTWTTYGKFRLGGLSKIFAIIVTIGTIGVIIGGHSFVPSITGDTFVPGLIYYTVVFYGLLIIAWFAFESRRFKGPPIGDEIKRRQAEIAKVEAKLEAR